MILGRPQISVLLIFIVLLWVLCLFAYGVLTYPIDLTIIWRFFKPFATVVTMLTLTLVVFDKWIWHWKFLNGWLVKIPDIRGTWFLEVHSNWIDPDTKRNPPVIRGYVSVFQTFSKLNLRLMTEQSSSDCLATKLLERDDGSFELAAVFMTTPKAKFRDRSEIHHGGMLLTLDGNPPERIEGSYWTSRASTGDLILTNRQSKTYSTYQTAVNNLAVIETDHSG
jgi:SMODS-associating 2TM, beta-strand rich effector domain